LSHWPACFSFHPDKGTKYISISSLLVLSTVNARPHPIAPMLRSSKLKTIRLHVLVPCSLPFHASQIEIDQFEMHSSLAASCGAYTDTQVSVPNLVASLYMQIQHKTDVPTKTTQRKRNPSLKCFTKELTTRATGYLSSLHLCPIACSCRFEIQVSRAVVTSPPLRLARMCILPVSARVTLGIPTHRRMMSQRRSNETELTSCFRLVRSILLQNQKLRDNLTFRSHARLIITSCISL